MSIEDESAISSVEAAVLADQEAIIAQGLKTFYAVGTALWTICDQRLYREDHSTFEDYCSARWGMQRSYAYRLIEAAGVVDDVRHTVQDGVSPIGDILPANEAQARALAMLPADQRGPAWQVAVETAPNNKPTAAHVAATVRNIQGPRPATQQEAPDPWDEPDADPDAELYSRPEPIPSPQPAPAHDVARARAEREAQDHAAWSQDLLAADQAVTGGQLASGMCLTEIQDYLNQARKPIRALLGYGVPDIQSALAQHPDRDYLLVDFHNLREMVGALLQGHPTPIGAARRDRKGA